SRIATDQCTAAAMMMAMAIDIAPTRTATATFCSCTTSFQRWYGVSRSRMTNDSAKTRIPSAANTTAFTTFCTGSISISLSSHVVVVAGVHRSVRAGVVPHRVRHVLDFVDAREAPAAVFSGREQRE